MTNWLFDHFLSALLLGNLVDIVRAVVSITVEHGIFILYICGFDEDKEWSFEVRHNRDTTLWQNDWNSQGLYPVSRPLTFMPYALPFYHS